MKPTGHVRIVGFAVEIARAGVEVRANIRPRYYMRPTRVRLLDSVATLGASIYLGGFADIEAFTLERMIGTNVWIIEPRELVPIIGPITGVEFFVMGSPGKVQGAIVGDEYA